MRPMHANRLGGLTAHLDSKVPSVQMCAQMESYIISAYTDSIGYTQQCVHAYMHARDIL